MSPLLHRRSSPTARTDQLPAVGAVPAARRPRTLRLPRVRQVILRARPDQVAADMVDRVLRWPSAHHAHVGIYAARSILDAVTDGRRVHPATRERAEAATVVALAAHSDRLRPLAARVDVALESARASCTLCSPSELCHRHQDVLGRWWDHRDTAAVAVVNTAVAALTTKPPAPASARPRRRRS